MTSKGFMDIDSDRAFYITIANLDKVDVSHPKRLKLGMVANLPVEKVYIEDERYKYAQAHMQTTVTAQLRLYNRSRSRLREAEGGT